MFLCQKWYIKKRNLILNFAEVDLAEVGLIFPENMYHTQLHLTHNPAS